MTPIFHDVRYAARQLRQAPAFTLIVAAGLAGAFVLSRVIAAQLYAVRPGDPSTYLAVAALLAATAPAATFIPALRASRADPAITMRQE